jgi:hypothetical protein
LPPPLKHAGGRPPKLQVVGESDAPRSMPAEIETVEQVVDAALIIPRPELPPAPVQGTVAAAWRRLCNSNAELVGEMCLHFHKTSYKASTSLSWEVLDLDFQSRALFPSGKSEL